MFTAKSQLDDKVTGFEAGADDYLTKPTHPAELQAHVKAFARSFCKGRQSNFIDNRAAQPRACPYRWCIGRPRWPWRNNCRPVNLASSIEKASKAVVILAEFRPGQGTLVGDLGLAKEKTERTAQNAAQRNYP
jgi:CheY-like chemotaxis protein